MTHTPTPEELRDLFRYNPDTGSIVWRKSGRPAFTRRGRRGQWVGAVRRRTLQAHRVAWAIHHGEWPKHQIDHINRDPSDNRISNLRDVTCAENNRNKGTISTNTSGIKGVSWHKKSQSWQAQIMVDRKAKHLGFFKSKEDAAAARRSAELVLLGV